MELQHVSWHTRPRKEKFLRKNHLGAAHYGYFKKNIVQKNLPI